MSEKFYCKYCGQSYPSIRNLTNNSCRNNPHGKNHVPYEGSEKPQYFCKYCGRSYPSIRNLTNNSCRNNPEGKYHEPAL